MLSVKLGGEVEIWEGTWNRARVGSGGTEEGMRYREKEQQK